MEKMKNMKKNGEKDWSERTKWTKNGKKGEIWEDILKTFHNLDNYSIQWKLLFAKDFGVPQNRPRVIMIGLRNDIIGSSKEDLLSFKKAKYPNPEELLSDLIDENYDILCKFDADLIFPNNYLERISEIFQNVLIFCWIIFNFLFHR